MFYNLKIALRNLRRSPVYSIINILGLGIGLSVVLLICLMIFNELSFDRSFVNREHVYRMNSHITKFLEGSVWSVTGNAVGPAAEENIPEVEKMVRTNVQSYAVKTDANLFKVNRFCWADNGFFSMFNTPFLAGSPETALSKPNSIAISETTANTFFGSENPVGKTLSINSDKEYEITAVFKDFPSNSSFGDYQVVGLFSSCYESWLYDNVQWGNLQHETFCQLTPGTDVSTVEAQIQQLMDKQMGENVFYNIHLQRFDRIHLYSAGNGQSYTYAPGDINRVKILTLLAIIILAVACINYMNLSTARAQKRSKEIGVSKVLGARRKNIVSRLFLETGLFTLSAFMLAFLLLFLLLPVFNSMMNQNIPLEIILNPLFLSGIVGVYLITTLISASYPALYMSGFAPLAVIRQSVFSKGSGHALVRKGLIITQFAVAIVLIAWVIIIRSQVHYMNHKDLGFNVENTIGIPLPSLSPGIDYKALQHDFQNESNILGTAITGSFGKFKAFPFGSGIPNLLFKNSRDRENMQNGSIFHTSYASPELIDLLGMKLIAGKTLPESLRSDDSVTYVVVNQKAVEYLETSPEDIIGKKIYTDNWNAKASYVCGVVRDFNVTNLHETISPCSFMNSDPGYDYLLLKIKESDISQQLQTYEGIFKKHYPNSLFEVQFPDITLEKAYEGDQQTNRIATGFSFLAILVACMGVFGLTTFMAEQRIKEIGVRKILGARTIDIVHLFTKDFLILLLISFVIALPIAWWVGNDYLNNFAFRISLSWWIFGLVILVILILTISTVCLQAVKAAMANPVKSIKTE